MRIQCLAPLALVAVAGSAAAQPVVFTQWRFNTQPTKQFVNSPAPSTGHGTAVPLGMTNNYLYYTSPNRTGSYVCCDVTASGGGTDTGSPNNCWRVRGTYDGTFANAGVGWSIFAPQYTQGAEFDVSTVNYSNIVFSFDWFTTNQGVHNMQVQYSTDGGTNWNNMGPLLATTAPNAWYDATISGVPLSFDFSSIPAANDNPNFRVRLVSAYDPTYTGAGAPTYTGASGGQYNNNSGNWRFDTITFQGTPVRSVPPAASAAVTPTAVCSAGGGLTFTVSVDSGVNPLSTGVVVKADLSSLGLSATQQFFDDGTHGDGTAGDSVYTYTAAVPSGRTVGTTTIPVTVTDAQGRTASASVPVVIGNCSTNSSSKVVISQTFGGGGHLGDIPQNDSPYEADYVEIYNRSAQVVSLDGWSIQYASAGTTTGFDSAQDQVVLSGNIQPGQYMLVRMSDPVPGFGALPTPDFAQLTGQGGMGDTGGRVVLARTTQLLGTNFSDPNIEDLVGYGAAAITYEGAAPAATPNPSSDTAIVRKASGSQDTNQNFNDLAGGTPTPHNRTSGGFLAGYPASAASAVCAGSDVLLTVRVSPGATSTNIAVSADVSAIEGAGHTVALYDDGTHGDVTAGDGVYSVDYSAPAGAAQGVYTVKFTTTDHQGHSDTANLPLAVGNCSDTGTPVVISKVYGGGGNATSGYNGDFAEIFNRSDTPIDLTGWSFQSCRVSDAGFDSRIVNLSGIINPGEYRLIVTNQLSATGEVLPPADFTADTLFGMESSFGRVALVASQDLIHEDFTRADIIDIVGYGSQSETFEGVAPTGTLSDITLAVRKNGGCQDNNQNAIDFDVVLAINPPNNSSTTAAPCNGVCRVDFNGDGFVDFFDFTDFVTCFEGGECPVGKTADYNGDGFPDFFDFSDFVTDFETGCG